MCALCAQYLAVSILPYPPISAAGFRCRPFNGSLKGAGKCRAGGPKGHSTNCEGFLIYVMCIWTGQD
jgi:hypothetical protein